MQIPPPAVRSVPRMRTKLRDDYNCCERLGTSHTTRRWSLRTCWAQSLNETLRCTSTPPTSAIWIGPTQSINTHSRMDLGGAGGWTRLPCTKHGTRGVPHSTGRELLYHSKNADKARFSLQDEAHIRELTVEKSKDARVFAQKPSSATSIFLYFVAASPQ